MIEDETIDLGELGYRKTSEDKLTYKNIIADAINWCRRTRGSTRFKEAVENLESIILFDIPGYKLQSQIDDIKEEMAVERIEKINKEKEKHGRYYLRNSVQAKLRLEIARWYWERYFQKLIQLLARENLLLETQKVVKLRMKKPMRETYGNEFNGSSDAIYP